MLEVGVALENRYRIARRLGGGGMGQVYLGYDARLADKPCAVKETVKLIDFGIVRLFDPAKRTDTLKWGPWDMRRPSNTQDKGRQRPVRTFPVSV